MEADIGWHTESGRFIFVSIDNQPRQEITSAAIATPSTSIVLAFASTIPAPIRFGFLNGEFSSLDLSSLECFNRCSPFFVGFVGDEGKTLAFAGFSVGGNVNFLEVSMC